MLNIPKAGWVAIALVVSLAAGAFLVGPPPEAAPATSAEAVADSEAETIAVTDPVHDRPFEVSVWTPTPASDRAELILISHGFSGDRTSHSDLAQMLAADGYTVAAPTHPDIAGLESTDPSLDPLVLRPRHLSLTLDALEVSADAPFVSVTAVGHSLGGYSALRLAGAQPALDGTLEAHCAAVDDPVLCSGQAANRFKAMVEDEVDLADARVDNVILLAPGYGPLFGQEGPSVDADILIVAAQDDNELPGGQVSALVDRLGARAESSTVDGGHYVFLRPCTEAEAVVVPLICEDAGGIDRASIHSTLGNQIGVFVQS